MNIGNHYGDLIQNNHILNRILMRGIGMYGKDKRLDAQRAITEVAIMHYVLQLSIARDDLSILVQVIE